MKIEQYGYYRGFLNYQRTDNLRPGFLPIGTTVHLQALWIAENNEMYAGQMIYSSAEIPFLIPEEDLVITFNEFKNSLFDKP
jgi:hypothetical protein